MEVKSEDKQKKIKIKKKRQPLNLDVSDEESAVDSHDLFSKRNEEFKSRLVESRLQSLQNCRSNDNELTEDVFTDITSNISSKVEPKNKEVNEIISLLDELNQTRNNVHKTDNNNMTNGLIIESDEWEPDCQQSVALNTRSKKGKTPQKKPIPKKANKKTNRRKSGRKSKQSFDEQKAFETLEVMDAMDDVQVVEDFNSSLNISQDIEEYIKDRDIEIKVKYKAVIEKFLVKSTEKFCKIMPLIAQKFSEKVSELIFDLNEKMIDSDSTPQSVGLTVSDIIVCHKRVSHKSVNNDLKDPNVLSLKLRDKSMKSGETMNVNKFDKIQVLIDWYSKFKNVDSNKFRIHFDGEELSPNSTIAECDIEDDSQIDVILL